MTRASLYSALFVPLLAACSSDAPLTTDGGTYVVDWQTTPAPIPLNEMFAIDVSVTTVDGAVAEGVTLDANAVMPAHGHGMDVTPTVNEAGEGRFTVDGMMLHMSGEWLMTFTFEAEEWPTEQAMVYIDCCDA